MLVLTLMRHGKSDWSDASSRDFDRPLASRGRRASQLVGAELRKRGATFDLVIASPALRVRQTLEEMREGYGDLPETRFEPSIYEASAATLLDCVRRAPDCRDLLLVGHNPGLQGFASALFSRADPLAPAVREKFPTAAVLRAKTDFRDWSQIEPGKAQAEFFLRPRDLASG